MNQNTWNYLKRRLIAALSGVAETSFNILKTTFNNQTEQFGVPNSDTAIVGIDRLGYNENVTVAFTNLPAGMTITDTVITAGESTAPVAYNFDGTTPAGNYVVTVTYTGGSIVKAWNVNFTVNP